MGKDRRSVRQIETDAIREYSEYLSELESFNKDKGIFQPIRAVVRKYRRGKTALERVINDAMDCQKVSSYGMLFTGDTSIVGYFAARRINNNKGLGFGCSFCAPDDFNNYQKYRGQLMAMTPKFGINVDDADACDQTRIIDIVKGINEECNLFNDDFFSMDRMANIFDKSFVAGYDDIITVYYFPETLDDQLTHFIDRCGRYYRSVPMDKAEA